MKGKRVAIPLQEGAPYDEFTAINTRALRELREHGAQASSDLGEALALLKEELQRYSSRGSYDPIAHSSVNCVCWYCRTRALLKQHEDKACPEDGDA